MAITLNVAGYADSDFLNPASSTLPLTVDTGSNRILVIAGAWRDGVLNPTSGDYVISYDDGLGGGLVNIRDQDSHPPIATSDPQAFCTLTYVLDPPVGNITVVLAGASGVPCSVVAFVLNNVDQSNPVPIGVLFDEGTGSNETQTLSASSDSNDIWQVAFGITDFSVTEYPLVADVGQTEQITDPGGVQETYSGLSSQPASGSPPIIGGWTKGGSVDRLVLLSYGVMNEAGGAPAVIQPQIFVSM